MSILSLLSKVYELVIYNQLSDYSDSFLNNIPCGFRKAHALSWQPVLHNEDFIGTILMDLETCDSMPHNLLVAKLKYYGVDKATLRLLLDYLICRKQGTKIGLSSLGVILILIQVYYKG